MSDDIKNTTVNTEEVENKAIATPIKNEPDITDIDLGFVEKKRFRIGGDFNRMLELNVSDLNITSRLKVGYPKLRKLVLEAQEKITSVPDTEDKFADLGVLADRLVEIDKEMRDIIDYIFDTNASEVCAPSGNMYDPVGGEFRFERIIDKLADLYTTGLSAEFKQLKNRVEKKTSKYTKKGSKYHK